MGTNQVDHRRSTVAGFKWVVDYNTLHIQTGQTELP